jgi:hypothetical protein
MLIAVASETSLWVQLALLSKRGMGLILHVLTRCNPAVLQVRAKVPFALDVAFEPEALQDSKGPADLLMGNHLTATLAQRSSEHESR